MWQPLKLWIHRALRDESGQTLAFAALCMPVLLGFLGLAIDVGHLRLARRQLQLAADAAALAAGLEMRVCGSTAPCSAMSLAGQSALTENGFTGSTVVYNCAAKPSGSLVLSLNLPPCALGSGDPNSAKSGYLEAQIQQPVKTWFIRVLGISTITLAARAEVRRGGGPCIYALDTAGASAINVTAGLTSVCGLVDESSSSTAFACAAGSVSAPFINVTGSASGLLCSPNPAVRTGAPRPVPADPLKYLATPSVPACGTSLTTPYVGSATPLVLTSGSPIFWPDKAYCGGITLGPLTKATFMPGTYVIKSTSALNGGLSISLLATVKGTGVTFYNAGPYGALSFSGTGVSAVTLTAPTSGTYSGILYFQDAANTAAASMLANLATGTNLQGGFYLPSAAFSYAVSTPQPYTMIVAKDITFKAAATLKNDLSSLASGSPLSADNVQLVE